jgi:ATP-dependent RNA helicase SUPV3L1/SUV3
MPGVDTSSIKAVLGPTNTGKTYLAIERMLGHESGMMGFPLRLLARENYDRVVRLRGAGAVALITGEERIVPPRPRYFLCTTEAMPLDRRVAFLGLDEIQLCADPERGHIFTHRLLHARGTAETMLLGAETIAPLIRQLVPEAVFERRERFSRLSYAGYKKLTRLPPRSAVIAFSAAQVYALAELLRRQRGGTAVVLGALSPRTRNAQVAMYEAGEVDYLVATDAIGMGLNMAIDHVAFSSLAKFDGHGMRRLHANEIGQIAGRAGRHMADGTFGPTAELEPFEPELVRALEEHQFENLRHLNWRSTDLDFASLDTLKASLEAPPPSPLLRRARAADDYLALTAMMADAEIRDMATGFDKVRLLWDVCQVPDFGRDMHDGHRRLVARLFRFLAGPGVIPEEFVARAVGRLDRTDGDIDTLVGRIAHVRTWTYVSHRGDWLADADGWQERARALEDKLSDALHERLTQRFVDRKTAVLVRRLREREQLVAAVTRDRRVVIEGEEVGRLDGFRFVAADAEVAGSSQLMSSTNRAMREALDRELVAFEAAPDAAFTLDAATGDIVWDGAAIARLARGAEALAPRIEVVPTDLLDASARERVRRRLAGWLEARLRADLAPLYALRDAPLAGAARGIAFRAVEGMGCAAGDGSAGQMRKLSDADRKMLTQLGLRCGVETVYLPPMLKGRVRPLKALLWLLQHDAAPDPGAPIRLPDGGATSLVREPNRPDGWYLALGFCPAGPLAVRADLLERLLADVRRGTREGPLPVTVPMMTTIGAAPEAFADVVRAFGYAVRTRAAEAAADPAGETTAEQVVDAAADPASESVTVLAADPQPSAPAPSVEDGAPAPVAPDPSLDTGMLVERRKPERRPRRPARRSRAAEKSLSGEAQQAEKTGDAAAAGNGKPKRSRRRRPNKPDSGGPPEAATRPSGTQGEGSKPAGGKKEGRHKPSRPARPRYDPDSPFAVLAGFKFRND